MKLRKTSIALLISSFSLPLTACSSGASDEGGSDDGTGGASTASGGGPGGGGSGGSGTGGGIGSGGASGTGGGSASGGGPASGGGSGSGGLNAGGTDGAGGGTGSGGDGSGGGSVSTFTEDSGLDCQVSEASDSNGGDSMKLPDPFTTWAGTQVTSQAEWRCRRRELVTEVERRILGRKAPPPATIGGSVDGTISETSYSVEVSNPGGEATIEGEVELPSSGSAPYPAVVYLTMPGFGGHSLPSDVLNSEGVATMSYDVTQVSSEAAGNFGSGGYFDANPDFEGETSALVAWAWGVSRIIDMLEKHPDVIDPTKIAVHGCSRLGKGAFVIGAFDERIALGLPLEPGTGGPAPLRALPVYGGQTLSGANGEASWFGPMSGSYSSSMAVDMDDVAVMYAPRGLLLMDNAHIAHLSYKANYLGVASARKVFSAMGAEDAAWYLGSSGDGGHCGVRPEYSNAIRNMIKKFLKGDESVTTGGLDTHANHAGVDVESWTASWSEGTIAP